jgi:hypothetical protein
MATLLFYLHRTVPTLRRALDTAHPDPSSSIARRGRRGPLAASRFRFNDAPGVLLGDATPSALAFELVTGDGVVVYHFTVRRDPHRTERRWRRPR